MEPHPLAGDVLVLNADYQPLNVCSTRRAILLLLLGKAEVLHHDDRILHGATRQIRKPSVVKLRYHVSRPFPQVQLSRRSILARDGHRCQYCGHTASDLTVDHVVPRKNGGPSTWENLVACCRRCNSHKGDRSPQQAGMRLLAQPRRPRFVPFISLTKYIAGLKNETWRTYLPYN